MSATWHCGKGGGGCNDYYELIMGNEMKKRGFDNMSRKRQHIRLVDTLNDFSSVECTVFIQCHSRGTVWSALCSYSAIHVVQCGVHCIHSVPFTWYSVECTVFIQCHSRGTV